ncbi:MAG: P1 family peptidase [Ornithinimicrobium sp.]|nr:P1 family peptidase [Ornithinimicrobium sp.]MDO5740511.1 P1 family peptidase [Ornithinimicrobium sp.]
MELTPGATNTLTDVEGLRVGHHQRTGEGYLTGTTVVLCPPEGALAGVDVRGGGPGTRETDLLDPSNLVDRVHAVTLSGGSAFGLAAADGAMRWLFERGRGFDVHGTGEGHVVPIVPAAVIFDLGRGGRWGATPGQEFGALACADAEAASTAQQLGCLGAGTGAQVAGGLKGGIGAASAVLPDGTVIAALMVLNAVGSTVDPRTGELYGARHLLPGDLDDIPGLARGATLRPPAADEVARSRELALDAGADGRPRTLATTIGVVATDVALSTTQCRRLAMSGHDGMARAVVPVHTMYDGDTIFGLSTARRGPADPLTFHLLQHAAGEVVTRALVRATLAAASVTTPAGSWRSYPDAFPSALALA